LRWFVWLFRFLFMSIIYWLRIVDLYQGVVVAYARLIVLGAFSLRGGGRGAGLVLRTKRIRDKALRRL
jgi:hypothetical protein